MPTLKHSNCLALPTEDAIVQTGESDKEGETITSQSYFVLLFLLPFNFTANGKLMNQLAMLKSNLHISDLTLPRQKTRGAQSEAHENGTVKNGSYATLKTTQSLRHIKLKMSIRLHSSNAIVFSCFSIRQQAELSLLSFNAKSESTIVCDLCFIHFSDERFLFITLARCVFSICVFSRN